MATKTYKPKRKISATESEEIKIPASSVDGLSTVATSGSYNDLSNKPTIPTVNNGKLTIQKNGTDVATFTANQSTNVTANITVPTKASDVNALSLDGGTIKKSKTIKMDASANSDGANLKWGTVNSKNPYIGYASDQVDGTFVVGSLLGTNYASGLAIGGGSGNLLWKGTKVATTSDIPTNYVTTNTAQDITAKKKFLNTLIVGAKDDGSTGFKVIQGDIAGGDTLFTVSVNGIDLDAHEHNIPLLIGGNAGTSGQVLTSHGAGNAPIWGDITKHGYTELTNENLNTITGVGWYRAASGNTCTNRPTNVGTSPFILEVEKCTSAEMRQTLYTRYWTNGFYIRTSTNSGSSWTSWQSQYTVDTGAQVFSGRKSFSGGINLTSSLQVGGSSGTAGQVLTSTGTGMPQWTTPTSGGGGSSNVIVDRPMIQGVEYTVFDSGEYGSFIGTFSLETQDSSITITVGNADYIITNNDWVHCRITIDKNNDFVYSTIAINTGNVNRTWSFSTLPSGGAVKISTDLTSSYMEHSICVIMKEVI